MTLSCVLGTLTWPKSKDLDNSEARQRGKKSQMHHLLATAVITSPRKDKGGSLWLFPKEKRPLKMSLWKLLKGGPTPQLLGLIVPSGRDVGPLISLLFFFLQKRFGLQFPQALLSEFKQHLTAWPSNNKWCLVARLLVA